MIIIFTQFINQKIKTYHFLLFFLVIKNTKKQKNLKIKKLFLKKTKRILI